MWALFVIAVGVSMDATAVAAAYAVRGARRLELLALAAVFGTFQFVMALTGALGGAVITRGLASLDHWVAFSLLAFVGGKMLWEAARGDAERGARTLVGSQLLVLGVATSIDALAVGVTLPALQLGAWAAASAIGASTFALSLGGAYAGRWVGKRLGCGMEVLGGVLLLLLGVKTLVEHVLGGCGS